MGDAFVRSANAHLERVLPPRVSNFKGNRNSLISELSFRLFASRCLRTLPFSIDKTQVELLALVGEVHQYISRLERSEVLAPMTEIEIEEAIVWADRLMKSLNFSSPGQAVVPRPRFSGCGIVDDCEGDILVGKTLFELKNVERDFRLADIRQLLCYCALNFASKQYEIQSVAVINARSGQYYRIDLNELALTISGVSVSELLSEIVRYVTTDMPSR